MKRQKQIEHELATGNFLIPSTVTVAEFLMDWLPKQQKRTLSGTTLHEVHQLLHNSFLLAVEWGKKFESGFYAKPDTPSPQAVPAAGEPTISMTALLELLKDADPEMKAKLRLALLT